jgi:membrane protease YdiL (CAAX protease family)
MRWLFGLLMVSISEESLDLGYALISLALILGVLPTIILTSSVFTAAHIGSPGENVLGLLQVSLFGAVCALSVFRTGLPWWAVAFHGMWNWTQEFLYGTLGSGYWTTGHAAVSPAGQSVHKRWVGLSRSKCFGGASSLLSYQLVQLRRRLRNG